MAGRSVCYNHGGKSLAGIASPLMKTGRYSKYLPERLQGRYEEATADPNLLVLREDIALLDARLADLLTRVDTGESGNRWKSVKESYKQYAKCRKTDFEAEALKDLQTAIYAGVTDTEAWEEIQGVLTQREKFVASERKRLVDLQQMITASDALVLVQRLAGIVGTHVSDRTALAAIMAEFSTVLHVADRPRADGNHLGVCASSAIEG